ncbi:MAG: ice-binding family protein [Dehalococcoidia bacterium]|nr:ice-binding family protein [Dehalococcoidia bacterium]
MLTNTKSRVTIPLVVVTALILSLLTVACSSPAPTPALTQTPTATAAPAAATPTATVIPVAATPTATAVPAVATPTATVIPAVATPTATAVPAAATPTATVIPAAATPTATAVPAATPTATAVPAVATPTATAVPAAATPTATAVPAVATPTATAVPAATPTPRPTPLAGRAPVALGSAGNFVILAKSGISATGTTSIVGDIGVSPIDSTAITGLGLIMDSSNTSSTSSLVTGSVYAADYTAPTPSKMTTAVSDMETAYTDAAGRTLPDATELGAGDISGKALAPGLYKWGTGVIITNGVSLTGGANDVWIFQIAGNLAVGNGAIVTLNGGAQAKNIFWQVAGQATLETTAAFKGVILSRTLIEMKTGATLNGRALAQTAVTMDANRVTP